MRQGGFHSPILFTAYMDELFQRLASSGMGCYMGAMFLGCLGYADDVGLLAPTIHALNCLISICLDYAQEYSILFNGSKSKFLVFRHADDDSRDLSITIGSDIVKETTAEVHLGHKLSSVDTARSLLKEAKGHFWASFNHLLSSYGGLRPDILCKLFISFCTSFYGSPLWCFNDVIDLANAWRTALKRIWMIPRNTHRVLVALLSNCMPLEVSFYKRFCKFAKSGLSGPSVVTGNVMRIIRGNPRSRFNHNCNFLMSVYDLDVFATASIDYDNYFYKWMA